MKNFKISFCHPIKGVLKLFKKDTNCAAYQFDVDTNEGGSLNVSLTDIPRGEWNLVLEWEYEERQYNYHRDISINY